MLLKTLQSRGIGVDGSINVSTDSRKIEQGCVFVALSGANFDGNLYAQQALDKGAAVAIVDKPEVAVNEHFILVENTLLALQELARDWRRQWGKQIIGITGTNGKTTTKELTAAVLKTKYNLHYTQGNFNNQIGVPLTLLQLTSAHELAIVEMGASHPGDIDELVNIAEPNCGLITNVGQAHLQGFGSFEGVKRTKSELYRYLEQHNGFIFLNQHNPHLVEMSQVGQASRLPAIPYLDGTAENVNGFLKVTLNNSPFRGQEGFLTHLVGLYNAENVLAALTVGKHFGVSYEQAAQAIVAYCPTNNRSQLIETERNNHVIVDAYNANVSSMTAAIENLRGTVVPDRCTLILGDMLELGKESTALHRQIIDLLQAKEFTKVWLVGTEFSKALNQLNTTPPSGGWGAFPNAQAVIEALQASPITNHTILLKGSHGIHLETVIPYL